jgi:hypothetical protein
MVAVNNVTLKRKSVGYFWVTKLQLQVDRL